MTVTLHSTYLKIWDALKKYNSLTVMHLNKITGLGMRRIRNILETLKCMEFVESVRHKNQQYRWSIKKR